jgi:NAD(P)-dependent dehydrogenase (short-subunit alcohol dehydrogenase family)
MRLVGKVAIISSAASGMGAATARLFAREGAKVVIADVLEQEGRQVAESIGPSSRFEPLDVTKEESWAAVVDATTRHFGKLDVLVNNAGIPQGGPPPGTSPTTNPFNGSNRQESVSFSDRGTYLVICNVRTHFLDGMFAFVKVVGPDDDVDDHHSHH